MEPIVHPQHIGVRIHCCICLQTALDSGPEASWATFLKDGYAVCDEHIDADVPPKRAVAQRNT